ncbi:MAG: hypothetical protein NTZ83_01130, partial [Candidatus Pacearchaeota archaeon]|nr:hypothetical protein [Candidatus Pacearchaeota archaeon]
MKKGLIKAGLIGFFSLLFFGVILFSLFSSAYSNEEKIVKNSTLFNFEANNTYLINTTLKFNLESLGNYKLMITTPSGERIFRVGSNDRFFFELLEEGTYHVSFERGNGKKFYEFVVILPDSEQEPKPEPEPEPIPGELIQEKAEINKPVSWSMVINESIFEIPNSTNLTLTKENGELFFDYNLTNINGTNYIQINENVSENISENLKLEYITGPPKIEEKIISENEKEVVVSSPEDLHYENVLSYTELPREVADKNYIKIYWKEEDRYLDFEAKDTNGNGLINYVEWTIPHLSEQTFEIIIITKAEHLSSDRTFISDIYEQVRALDDIWSEVIPAGDYVRIAFEQNLTSSKDITLYPRIISGNPTIEVYEKYGTEKIAEFTSLIPDEYNKVLLTNLQEEQNTFDLKVVGGSVEFDHIIDPPPV